ncbi:hypothetical protein Scep_018929 [Stephania cephalantha]|uniref:Uncharacterized protein n=1 Tax=Stephania cephalantha TaxID=152367 RepID=A0AAP0I9Z5_9MAGN
MSTESYSEIVLTDCMPQRTVTNWCSESALSASKKVQFKSPSKPDSVLHFLRNHGFSDTQIANLVTKRPLLLLAKPQHTLLPKLKFLNELGLSEPEIAHYLSTDPTILFRGLESKIKPSYEYLKSLLGTDENVAATIKSSCSSWIFNFDLRRVIGQKVEILRKYGVPEKNIAKLVMFRPQSLSKNGDRFEELVENISEMGLNPSSMQFVNALYIFAGMSVNTLESKLRIFESYGWSEDEIVSAIRNQPVCISISKEKLNVGLNFFMNKLKWEPSKLAKDANLLGLSLEKRVIPRWMVIQYLHSKCLIKDAVSIRCVLKLTEAKFLDKFLDNLLRRGFSSENRATTQFHFLLLQTQFHKPISTTPPPQNPSDQSSSFTVSYLVNSCGLSPESALSASKKVHFISPTKPDLVLHFFRNHGFSNTQIANIASKRPSILLAKPHQTLLPKLDFFNEIGFSGPEIAHFLSKDPTFLIRSLERQIKPYYEYLKSLLGTDKKVASAIKSSCSSWILRFDIQRVIGRKVEILRKYGVSEANVAKLVMDSPSSFSKNDDRFDDLVRNVSEMGFDPTSPLFVNAVDVFSGMKRNTLDAKLHTFKSYGWSEDEIVSAIRIHPTCISISEEKLKNALEFFVNKLKWKPLQLAKCPVLLGLSLQERIIPRWMIIQCLLSKCLIKDTVSLRAVLKLSEAQFFIRFLNKYENTIDSFSKCSASKRMSSFIVLSSYIAKFKRSSTPHKTVRRLDYCSDEDWSRVLRGVIGLVNEGPSFFFWLNARSIFIQVLKGGLLNNWVEEAECYSTHISIS